jgi:hypothetical protein
VGGRLESMMGQRQVDQAALFDEFSLGLGALTNA